MLGLSWGLTPIKFYRNNKNISNQEKYTMQITGKVAYQNLGTGFWGIIGNDGQEWRPVNMPSKLQQEGLQVVVEAEESANQMSVFMWGTAINIKKVIKP